MSNTVANTFVSVSLDCMSIVSLDCVVSDCVSLNCVAGGGGGSTKPPVGMLPAKIGLDSAHKSANAIASRFMDVAPFEV